MSNVVLIFFWVQRQPATVSSNNQQATTGNGNAIALSAGADLFGIARRIKKRQITTGETGMIKMRKNGKLQMGAARR